MRGMPLLPVVSLSKPVDAPPGGFDFGPTANGTGFSFGATATDATRTTDSSSSTFKSVHEANSVSFGGDAGSFGSKANNGTPFTFPSDKPTTSPVIFPLKQFLAQETSPASPIANDKPLSQATASTTGMGRKRARHYDDDNDEFAGSHTKRAR